MNAFQCPVFIDLSGSLEKAHSFAKAMRRLRKSLRRCRACDQYDNCPVMQQFRLAIEVSLEEITRQWNLDV